MPEKQSLPRMLLRLPHRLYAGPDAQTVYHSGGHSERVATYALMLGTQLCLDSTELKVLVDGARHHDIGKVAINSAMLWKAGPLAAEEFEEIKKHTTIGATLLYEVPAFRSIVPIARSHHERWDGTGYPDRLAEDEIPLMARIVAIAEAFDVMTSRARYHPDGKDISPDAAFAEIQQMSGKQFDPKCVAGFWAIHCEVIDAMHAASQSAHLPIIAGSAMASR